MGSVPSQAAQVMITIIPIVGIVVAGVIVLLFLLWNHQEHIKLIEQGITPPQRTDLQTFSLLAGLLAATVGAVLTAFFLIVQDGSYSLLGGLIPLAVGVSLLVFYRIRSGAMKK